MSARFLRYAFLSVAPAPFELCLFELPFRTALPRSLHDEEVPAVDSRSLVGEDAFLGSLRLTAMGALRVFSSRHCRS